MSSNQGSHLSESIQTWTVWGLILYDGIIYQDPFPEMGLEVKF